MRKLTKALAAAALCAPLLLSGCAKAGSDLEANYAQPTASAPSAAPVASTPAVSAVTFVPDIVGLTPDEVKPVLSSLGLEASWSGGDAGEGSDWVVSGVKPKVGSQLTRGDEVSITLRHSDTYARAQLSKVEAAAEKANARESAAKAKRVLTQKARKASSTPSRSVTGTTKASTSSGSGSGSGNGYKVTCRDGTPSYSGGIQGACSHHGGVAG